MELAQNRYDGCSVRHWRDKANAVHSSKFSVRETIDIHAPELNDKLIASAIIGLANTQIYACEPCVLFWFNSKLRDGPWAMHIEFVESFAAAHAARA